MDNGKNSKNGRKLIDLTGRTYTRLSVFGRDSNSKFKNPYWICMCDCGTIKSIEGSSLREGKTKDCGKHREFPLVDLTGRVFGRLTVIGEAPRLKKYIRRWLCRCSCENKTEKIVGQMLLTEGHTTSCGCYRREEATKNATKHGLRFTPEYYVWREMVSRMTNPNNPGYKNYGGRGLLLDPDFLTFEGFISHIGRRPSSDLTLERLDNSKGYEKNNIIWSNRSNQANNTRANVPMTLDGKTLTMKQWSDLLGINYGTLRERVRVLGWDDRKALTTPTRFITKLPRSSLRPISTTKKSNDPISS